MTLGLERLLAQEGDIVAQMMEGFICKKQREEEALALKKIRGKQMKCFKLSY